MRAESRTALAEWAVTCDALARGEQILLLRADDPLAAESGGDADLRRSEFWLCPTWSDQRVADLTDPYRDRVRRLMQLHRDDGRTRIRYYATVEYRERISEVERLLRLDVEHTLNRRAVEERAASAGAAGVWFLLLRVYRRPETAVLAERPPASADTPWLNLGRPVSTEGARPVLGGERFLREKARLLRVAGCIEAV